MEKIGVLGLGSIAQKAYLPVMSAMQDRYEWHLTTRNEEKGQELCQKYGFTHYHQTLDELIAAEPKAVFVHTPTDTHEEIVTKLLNAGIHVYVDKPLAEDPEVVKHLYELAESQNLLLTVGFNRRFAPFNQVLKRLGKKQTILAEKNRPQDDQNAKFAIYDLMIHVIDTALYLMDEPLHDQSTRMIVDQGNLQQVYVTLNSEHEHADASMNLHSGLNFETTTVQTNQTRQIVTNLNELHIIESSKETLQTPEDWMKTLRIRGFVPIIEAFLGAVTRGLPNPVSPKSSILTHQVCANILNAQPKA